MCDAAIEGVISREVEYELKALDTVNGYQVRPGFYDQNGATALSNTCVNFTSLLQL